MKSFDVQVTVLLLVIGAVFAIDAWFLINASPGGPSSKGASAANVTRVVETTTASQSSVAGVTSSGGDAADLEATATPTVTPGPSSAPEERDAVETPIPARPLPTSTPQLLPGTPTPVATVAGR